MRRWIAPLLFCTLLFSSLESASAVTPKTGATCKKLGAVVIAAGKEFKCIKKGSKRVWSKGVTVRATPANTSTKSPSPATTVSPSATPSAIASPSPVASVTATPTPAVATTQAATPTPSPTRVASPTPTPTPSSTSTVREFTRAEVAQRNTNSSCWTIVNESVYDLTSWINSHPGGPSAIRSLCGTDGTSAFTGTHGNSGSPMRELSSRYLGKLK